MEEQAEEQDEAQAEEQKEEYVEEKEQNEDTQETWYWKVLRISHRLYLVYAQKIRLKTKWTTFKFQYIECSSILKFDPISIRFKFLSLTYGTNKLSFEFGIIWTYSEFMMKTSILKRFTFTLMFQGQYYDFQRYS